MSFIRPEAATVLRTWGIPAALAIAGVAMIWHGWALAGRGAWVGFLLIALGVLSCLALFGALERAMTGWRGRHGAPGIVTVDEGRISYFAPFGGGIVALDALTRVEIVTTNHGPMEDDLFWRLSDSMGQEVAIPGGAKGVEGLLDILGTLPGFDHMAVVRAMGSTDIARFVLWQRAAAPGIGG
ncbi:MAG: hypothetical protein AB8B85_10895 [Paracoccaceae bacterium]